MKDLIDMMVIYFILGVQSIFLGVIFAETTFKFDLFGFLGVGFFMLSLLSGLLDLHLNSKRKKNGRKI